MAQAMKILDGTIRIIPETNSNSLVLKASEANLIFLQEIIKDLDVSPDGTDPDPYFPTPIRSR